jgi:hypothetical protein
MSILKTPSFLAAAALLLTVLVIGGCAFTRAGYESPKYTVLEKEGSFEMRQYLKMHLATTAMRNSDGVDNQSFMRLFRYIGGDNDQEKKISMTTPVFRTGELVDGEASKMSFVVPQEIVRAGRIPQGKDGIEIETMEGGNFAVYRFSGSWDTQRRLEGEKKLSEWMRAKKLRAAGSPMVGNYDPPFTPPMLRRNEILVRIAKD